MKGSVVFRNLVFLRDYEGGFDQYTHLPLFPDGEESSPIDPQRCFIRGETCVELFDAGTPYLIKGTFENITPDPQTGEFGSIFKHDNEFFCVQGVVDFDNALVNLYFNKSIAKNTKTEFSATFMTLAQVIPDA